MRIGATEAEDPSIARFDLNRSTLPFFIERVRRIQRDTPRRWGRMDSTRAIRHLITVFEMSLGIQQARDASIPVLRHLLFVMFNVWFTNWPKGLKGPDYLTPEPEGDFADEQAQLIARMEQFVDALEREPGKLETNPSLGPMPLRRWSRAHGVHCDHHLRQFGV